MSAALSAARVQVNQYQWANTNTQTNTSHMCMSGSLCPNACVPTAFKYIQHIQKHMGFQMNALTHIRSSVGTPVTLHVPIVVHLAVLCSTLFSQHASHLKPNTYGPASCRSRALWCWGHSTWHRAMTAFLLIVATLLYSRPYSLKHFDEQPATLGGSL